MTIKIDVKDTGKIIGIKGLYKDLSSGRLYVRANVDGLDKQMTIKDECRTFSELKRSSERALNSLHRANGQKQRCREMETKDLIEDGCYELQKQIVKIWSLRRISEKKLKEYLRCVSGLCLCSNKKFQKQIDDYNIRILNEKIYNGLKSRQWQHESFKNINTIFKRLILSQVHLGQNPCDSIKRPKGAQKRITGQLDFNKAALVVLAIRSKYSGVNAAEIELFFRLCFETGQRPRDVYMFDCRKIYNGYYTFYSHKTERQQRVSHLLSKDVLELVSTILDSRKVEFYKQSFKNEFSGNEVIECFWPLASDTYSRYLNKIIHSLFGMQITLYSCKHFFISEIFRMTESDFWAEAFTHEGRSANTRHYLHPDQKRADDILSEYLNNFEKCIKEKATNFGGHDDSLCFSSFKRFTE